MVSNSFTGMEIIKEVPTGEQFGIAVSKDNPKLTQAINDAITTIKDSGTYDKLYAIQGRLLAWHDVAPSHVAHCDSTGRALRHPHHDQ